MIGFEEGDEEVQASIFVSGHPNFSVFSPSLSLSLYLNARMEWMSLNLASSTGRIVGRELIYGQRVFWPDQTVILLANHTQAKWDKIAGHEAAWSGGGHSRE